MRTDATINVSSKIGQSFPQKDGIPKVTGTAQYVADIELSGMIYGKALRSQHVHSKILNIDTSKAEKVPGVIRIITSSDIPGCQFLGRKILDQPVICKDKVKNIGDVVVLVAAESIEAAQKACELVIIDYEVLEPLTDVEDALMSTTQLVHEDMSNNILHHCKIIKGDTEKEFPNCDIIICNKFTTSFLDHMALETECAIASMRDNVSIDVWGSSDHPFLTRANIARVLGIDVNLVHFHNMTIGGSFGSRKDSSFDVCSRTALLAFITRRPVKMDYTREESLAAKVKRHASIINHKIGATKDGKILACEIKVILDTGAYSAKGDGDWGVPNIASIFASGPYEIPHVQVNTYSVYTNNPFAGAMRGFGSPQVLFAHESQMDDLAKALNITPLDLRKKNALKIGSKTATGNVLDHSVGIIQTIDEVNKRIEINLKKYPKPKEGMKRGTGIACGWYLTGNGGGNEFAQALIYLTSEGSIELRTGLCDVGQGSKTTLAQICAEEMELNFEHIIVPDNDTDLDPHSMNTGASRVTTFGGNATIMAAKGAKTRLIELAAALLCEPIESMEWKNGEILHKSVHSKKTNLKEIAERILNFYGRERLLIGHGFWQTSCHLGMDNDTGQGIPHHVYAYATHAAVVDVDPESGEIDFIDYIAAQDVGRAINPIGVKKQLEGGIAMGIGMALMEELILDYGKILNCSMKNYLVPTAADIPNIDCIIVEEANELGPFGAKGIGEASVNPVPGAIANAINNAIGMRVCSLPMTSERIWSCLSTSKQLSGRRI
jgi:nicotinate dehydrogenase large molybdopterin subunit